MVAARSRREFLGATSALGLAALSGSAFPATPQQRTMTRVRPGDPAWPDAAAWQALDRATGGHLVAVRSPLAACGPSGNVDACDALFRALKNPYAIGDNVALTQTSGWVDAWSSSPSAYAVAAHSTADVVAAVNFARERRLRLVVKGGGHSYQGTSNAADSLLVWTRAMNTIALHDAFVGQGCDGRVAPQPAVSIGSGAIWMHVYQAVMAGAGRYVQGGGCATVGVAGLIQSGGFGSFSKAFGMAAAGLIEAEVVTADGRVRIANACSEPELYWGLKGGGGGSLGVVTRLTLRTRELPAWLGGIRLVVKARSPDAYRRLVARFVAFYEAQLFNPHWGEQAAFAPDDTLTVAMVFQGLTKAEATAVWQPFVDALRAAPGDYSVTSELVVIALPGQKFFNPDTLRALPGVVIGDDRPGAPANDVFWSGNLGEAGQFLYAYQSAWLPARWLVAGAGQARLADALYAASRRHRVSLHFNKGLAGAPAADVAAARQTATHPIVAESFALAISAAEGPPAFFGIPGHAPDVAAGREAARSVDAAMQALQPLLAVRGSYVSEGNYFDSDWQRAYWGPHYARLRRAKDRYDPDGLFFVHHGVGSEDWSADGFQRIAR